MFPSYQRRLSSYCSEEEFEADDKERWFPRTCCKTHEQYDLRTPGLFKMEFQGSEMVGLFSKTYCLYSADISTTKMSVDGVFRHDNIPIDTLKQVSTTNSGMRVHKNTVFLV